MNESVQQIHDSDAYGSFYDFGTDMGLYSDLWNQPGASKTIAQYISYYSKERQQQEVPSLPEIRSVSKEKVIQVFKKWYNERNGNIVLEKENLCFVASWQVGPDMTNHGWIFVYYKDRIGLFHATVPPFPNRSLFRDTRKLRALGAANASFVHLCILNHMILGNTDELPYVDIAYTGIYHADEMKMKIDPVMFNSVAGNSFWAFDTQTKQFIRPEKALRGKEKVVIFKGSFNPWHEAHADVVDIVHSNFDEVVPMISIINFDKPKLTPEEVLKRINIIRNSTDQIRYIFVTTDAMFMSNHIAFQDKLGINVTFAVGEDVYEKVSKEHKQNLDFVVLERKKKISSTQLRLEDCNCGKSYAECTLFTTGCNRTPELEFNYA